MTSDRIESSRGRYHVFLENGKPIIEIDGSSRVSTEGIEDLTDLKVEGIKDLTDLFVAIASVLNQLYDNDNTQF